MFVLLPHWRAAKAAAVLYFAALMVKHAAKLQKIVVIQLICK